MKIEFQSLDKENRYPPVPALQVLEEFKRIPSRSENNTMTVKHCMPMVEHLSSGYALRLQTRMIVNRKDYAHPHEQLPLEMYGRKNDYLKFYNNWIVKTPEGYSSMFYSVFGEERFKIFSGIVATDKYSTPVLLPAVRLKDEDFVLEEGTPIAIVFPFKRENWSSEIVEYNSETMMRKVEEETEFEEHDHYYKKFVHVKNNFR